MAYKNGFQLALLAFVGGMPWPSVAGEMPEAPTLASLGVSAAHQRLVDDSLQMCGLFAETLFSDLDCGRAPISLYLRDIDVILNVEKARTTRSDPTIQFRKEGEWLLTSAHVVPIPIFVNVGVDDLMVAQIPSCDAYNEVVDGVTGAMLERLEREGSPRHSHATCTVLALHELFHTYQINQVRAGNIEDTNAQERAVDEGRRSMDDLLAEKRLLLDVLNAADAHTAREKLAAYFEIRAAHTAKLTPGEVSSEAYSEWQEGLATALEVLVADAALRQGWAPEHLDESGRESFLRDLKGLREARWRLARAPDAFLKRLGWNYELGFLKVFILEKWDPEWQRHVVAPAANLDELLNGILSRP